MNFLLTFLLFFVGICFAFMALKSAVLLGLAFRYRNLGVVYPPDRFRVRQKE